MTYGERLKRMHCFLEFWHSPYNSEKSIKWDGFTNLPMMLESALAICDMILKDKYEYVIECPSDKHPRFNWSVLEGNHASTSRQHT